MTVLPVDTRPIGFRAKNRSITFTPAGDRVFVGARARNPVKEVYSDSQAARLFVGFLEKDGVTMVRGSSSRALNALISLVKRVRKRQVGMPDASFLTQRGVYTHRATGHVVTEPGAQVVIVDMAGSSKQAWTDQMVELAEIIAKEFKQESVYVDLQVNGVTTKVLDVGA